MRNYSKTEIIFKQIEDIYLEMFQCRRAPIKFNSLFEAYLIKSQQLTDTMRKEYAHYTSQKWEASNFPYWDEYTQVIKRLRNKVIHGEPLILQHAIISIFPAVEFLIDEYPPKFYGRKYRFRVFWQETIDNHPFWEERTKMLAAIPVKSPKSEGFSDKYVMPIKEFFTYSFGYPLLNECITKELLLRDKKCRDAIYLLTRAHRVYKNYFDFYKRKLKENNLRSSIL